MRGDIDNPGGEAGGSFLPSSRAIFLPSSLIIGGYAAAFLTLWMLGHGQDMLARLCLLVLALGGPFLAAQAVLRRYTIRVDVRPHAVYVHSGFPRRAPHEIPYAQIRRLALTRDPVGRLTGSGTLVFEILDGTRVTVADLARPDAALRAVGRRIDGTAVAVAPQPTSRNRTVHSPFCTDKAG